MNTGVATIYSGEKQNTLHAACTNIYIYINNNNRTPLPLKEKTRARSIYTTSIKTTQLVKMSIDPKFVELAADVIINRILL